MSIWKELKKVVNSNFSKSLDKQLDEAKTELTDLIKSQRILGASDSVLAVVSSKEVTGDVYSFGTFTPSVSGSVRLMAGGEAQSGYDGSIEFMKGSSTVARLEFGDNYKELYVDIPVTAGTEYKIVQDGYRLTTEYIKIGATVIDGSMAEFIPAEN